MSAALQIVTETVEITEARPGQKRHLSAESLAWLAAPVRPRGTRRAQCACGATLEADGVLGGAGVRSCSIGCAVATATAARAA